MQLPMPLALPLCCAGAGHGAQPGAHHGAGGRGAGGRCAGASVCGCVLCGCVYVFCRLMWVGWGHGRASSWARDGEAGRQPGVTGQVLAARPANDGAGTLQGGAWQSARAQGVDACPASPPILSSSSTNTITAPHPSPTSVLRARCPHTTARKPSARVLPPMFCRFVTTTARRPAAAGSGRGHLPHGQAAQRVQQCGDRDRGGGPAAKVGGLGPASLA